MSIFLLLLSSIVVKVTGLEGSHITSHLQNKDELLKSVMLASGVYINNDAKNSNLNPFSPLAKTLILTSGNFGYANHIHNLKCFLDRLGLKFLVIALDEHTHIQLAKDGMNVFYWTGHGSDVMESSTEWQSKQFHVITNRKKEAVLGIMNLGYDVLFIDADTAVLRDPIPHVIWKNVDYVHSVNVKCPKSDVWDFKTSEDEGNTGFYFVRSNAKTIKLWNTFFNIDVPKNPDLDDQTIFWMTIRKSIDPPIQPLKKCGNFDSINLANSSSLVSCPLDGCMFSSGAVRGLGPAGAMEVHAKEGEAYGRLRDSLKSRGEKLCAVHANYIVGNERKANALDRHGYWLATQTSDGASWAGACKPFIDPEF